MKRKIFLLASLCFLIFPIVSGASYKVKKLQMELARATSPERKTELLIDIANEIKGSIPDSAIWFFDQAEKLGRQLPDIRQKDALLVKVMIGRASVEIAKGNLDAAWSLDSIALIRSRQLRNRELEAATLMSQGSIFYNRSQFNEAQKCNEEALKIIRKTSDRKTEGKIVTNMGTIEFMLGNSAKADTLFRIPLKLARESNDDDLLAASLQNLGLLNVYRGEYGKAEEYIRQSAEVYQKIDGKDGLVLCYQNLANIWIEQGYLGKGIDYTMLQLGISIELSDKPGIGKAYQNLGECYAQIGDYEQALNFFIKGLEVKTNLGNTQEIATTHSSIGHLLYQQGDFKRALEYYRKSLHDFRKIGYVVGTASSYSDIGSILAEQNKPDSALYFFKMAEEIYSKNEHLNYLANIYMKTGKVYFSLKDYSLAGSYYKKAEAIKIQVGDQLGIYDVSGMFASLYFQKSKTFLPSSQQRKQTLAKALGYAQKAFKLADSLNHLPGQKESSGYLMDIYEGLGNPAEALKYARIKMERSDSLGRKQRSEALVNAEIRWKAERKQVEIDLLQKEKSLQAKVIGQQSALNDRLYLIIGAILVVLALIAGIAFLYGKNKKKQKDIDFQKHLNEIAKLKMQNINNRLSPHLFFNMLGSLSGEVDDPEKMRQQISHVAVLLRMSLENSDRTAIPLSEELEMVKSYVELQRSRIPEPFSAEFRIPENISLETQVPAMILQIPVENAIKHGLMPLDGEKKLLVSVEMTDDYMEIFIEDNGIGRVNSKGRTKGTGTGLKVLLQTIRLLNQQNKEQIAFRIADNEPQGTTVRITLPRNCSYQLVH